MKDAATRMSHTRTKLILDHPWFGSLSIRLKLIEDESCKTLCTNGSVIKYCPSYVQTLSDEHLMGVVAHEVLHCALKHMYRMGARDPHRWNIATDKVINEHLYECGFTLPDGVLRDSDAKNKSAEEVYGNEPEPPEGEGGSGKPGMEDCPTGYFEAPAPPSPGNEQDGADGQQDPGMTEFDWEMAVDQATAIASKAGKIPAGLERAVRRKPVNEDGWEVLKQFLQKIFPSDYSWSPPNRRFAWQGIYLPGTVKENMPKITIAVDTSGSIVGPMLNLFSAKVTEIMEQVRPEAINVIYCDAEINGEETFTPDDLEFNLKPKGGGGTAFQPVFDHIQESGEDPVAMIYLTDLMSYDISSIKQPDYPVFWVVPQQFQSYQHPWGERINVEDPSRR